MSRLTTNISCPCRKEFNKYVAYKRHLMSQDDRCRRDENIFNPPVVLRSRKEGRKGVRREGRKGGRKDRRKEERKEGKK